MSIFYRISLVFLVILVGLLMGLGIVRAAQSLDGLLSASAPEVPADHRVIDSPDISPIDSPTASCVMSNNQCFVTWTYFYVYADPSYIITSTVQIDNINRAYYSGFFQKNMYIPTEMLRFQVACAQPVPHQATQPTLAHSYTIRARDSAGLKSANYGTVYCPAFFPKRYFMPVIKH